MREGGIFDSSDGIIEAAIYDDYFQGKEIITWKLELMKNNVKYFFKNK